ncbi:MAG TPA: hypothetical protein DCZ92_15270 [Elusimicrobia bacterium]|nr:MAG: hypothetical protein A2016_03145 [Elusimicrobia bacterium GWF2_62_30]HBA62140.1 hypothetical protein [Elusimicrobiota bacterium]
MFALAGAAAGAVGEDKADQENALERKAEREITNLLGPGKARVTVRVAPEPGAGPLTVFIALSDSVTDEETQKIRAAVSGLIGIDPGRGDELLLMKPGFAPGRDEPGGLGKYGSRGLLVLAGIVIGFIFSGMKRQAADVKSAAARVPLKPVTPGQYVPPPAQPQPASPENDELNIRNHSGFYK